MLPDGSKQAFVQPKTPSDWRSSRNQLSRLRRLDSQARLRQGNAPPLDLRAALSSAVCEELRSAAGAAAAMAVDAA